ncbi:MAG: restriction system-associated AAA family ATPase, partial [Sedimenticola sp.]
MELGFRDSENLSGSFEPFCLIGPNGAGKSQLIQVIAEIFQSAIHAVSKEEERIESNPDLQFEVEYLIQIDSETAKRVRLSREAIGKAKPKVLIQAYEDGDWIEQNLSADETRWLLPSKVVGYTSGGNETLSLPFLLSRGGYAADVTEAALHEQRSDEKVPDTCLMAVDYGTHLEVLISNLVLGEENQKAPLIQEAGLSGLHSFRCTVQLAHSAVPKTPISKRGVRGRKGIQLTEELEEYLDQLKRCATCYSYDDEIEAYTFDYLVDDQTKSAFRSFWESSLELYASLHKIAMLNDLAIPRKTRKRFTKEIEQRQFASKLPEPQDEDKVFRFDQVSFKTKDKKSVVDYVSLSDGEHQLALLLGTFSMLSYPNVLFLLDEPESHFNPQWRIKLLSRLLELPTRNGKRGAASEAAKQECLLTTHTPFVPSDMKRENVLIFEKSTDDKAAQNKRSAKSKPRITIRHPEAETFGTTFDSILEECFGVSPPISRVSLDEIGQLMKSDNPEEIRIGMEKLGHSVEKM